MQVMRGICFLFIRIASICWGLLELSGFLWFLRERDTLVSLYWAAPAIALLILGVAPAKIWSNVVSRTVLFAIAVVGALRSIDILATDISAPGGPDISSAMLRVITVALLLLLIWVRGRPDLRSRDSHPIVS